MRYKTSHYICHFFLVFDERGIYDQQLISYITVYTNTLNNLICI